jgi:hypothetical protein
MIMETLLATSTREDTVSSVIQFGERVEGYVIPVVNEREVRAAAGILFLATFLSLMFILFKAQFMPIKYVITLFLTDFLIRVLINPKYSPTLVLGRLVVRNQVPEYVGAQQKKFAWIIGILLSATMFVLMVVMNTYSVITGIVCLICLVFLFFESAFGICLGCMVYPWIYKERAQYCPGEVCDVKKKQDIQRTSWVQLLVLAVFILYAAGVIHVVNTKVPTKPHALFGRVTAKP